MSAYGIKWDSLKLQCNCGNVMDTAVYFADDRMVAANGTCECGVQVGIDFDYDNDSLPTRLEGSD